MTENRMIKLVKALNPIPSEEEMLESEKREARGIARMEALGPNEAKRRRVQILASFALTAAVGYGSFQYETEEIKVIDEAINFIAEKPEESLACPENLDFLQISPKNSCFAHMDTIVTELLEGRKLAEQFSNAAISTVTTLGTTSLIIAGYWLYRERKHALEVTNNNVTPS